MQKIGVKQVLKYSLMPALFPRFRDLLHSGFGSFAYFIAQVFRATRLLEDGHPYLNVANIGRFGMRHVFAEAASRLEFRREGIDQIAVFVLMLGGVALMAAQIFLLGLALLMGAAHAADPEMPTNFFGYFQRSDDDSTFDIAHILLDRVFGLEDFFHSCVAKAVSCLPEGGTDTSVPFPYPFHTALHQMLAFYSTGLMVFAVLIFLYFVIAVAAETAQSGTPFGRRFNRVWAPVRMVVALGLLVPFNPGLNSAQWILMFAARLGSDFASNGWSLFLDAAIGGDGSDISSDSYTPTGDKPEALVAVPNPPPLNTLMEFLTTVAACKMGVEKLYQNATGKTVEIDAYLINSDQMGPAKAGGEAITLSSADLDKALDYSAKNAVDKEGNPIKIPQDIRVVFGEKSASHTENAASIAPTCGTLLFPVTDMDTEGSPGSRLILEAYWQLVRDFWEDALDSSGISCNDVGKGGGGGDDPGAPLWSIAGCVDAIYLADGDANGAALPPDVGSILSSVMQNYNGRVGTAIEQGTKKQVSNGNWALELKKRGWAGAGIWYNKIAELNGTLIGAAYNLPAPVEYPAVMEEVKRLRYQNDRDITGLERYMPYWSKGDQQLLADTNEEALSKALYNAQKVWFDNYSTMQSTGNFLIDGINLVFGLQGLFNIHENGSNEHRPAIHPLAQLSVIGKGIVDASIRNLGWSFGASLLGGAASIADMGKLAGVFSLASRFLSTIAMLGLGIGFVLYYIIPFLPFIYFFFSVGRWIKGIFEAMVGVPLWALAHIRIDGEGLAGEAAIQGYFMILEIFLRPILLVFGLLAAITIFAAQVRILNEIWPLVTSNVSGFDTGAAADGDQTGAIVYLRSSIDRLFYTVIYTITCYMMGLSSFKLIDLIPEHILRWMGTSVHIFGEDNGDPASHLVGNTMVGSQIVSQSAQGVFQGARSAIDNSAKFARDVAKGNIVNT
jgi:conjugal transfer/type IV secretion protein DotA/TraY